MEQEKVTEELVRQNGNQAAAVMADYAAQGGGGSSETGIIPEGNYVQVQENAALAYIGESGETVFQFEPMLTPKRIYAAAVDTSSYPDGILASVRSEYHLSTSQNVEKAYKSMINGFVYAQAGNFYWVKPTAFTPWDPNGRNTYLEFTVACGGASRSVIIMWGA